jgi:hypothetical protein
MRVSHRRLAAAAAVLLLAISSAAAQQIIVCHSLYDDLVNFDRRAHHVGGYYLPHIMEIRNALTAMAEQYREACWFGPSQDVDCPALKARGLALYREYRDRAASPLGGSDPVRRQILLEMRRSGCPPPDDPAAALAFQSLSQRRPSPYMRPRD